MNYHLQVLGRFELLSPAGQNIAITSKKNQALIAVLGIAGGQPVLRSSLCNLLWEDRAEEQARNSLRQAFTALRQAFSSQGDSPLAVDDEAAAFDVAMIDVDATQLVAAVAGDAIGFQKSISNGEFLEGLVLRGPTAEHWLSSERRRFTVLRCEGLAKQIKRFEEEGNSTAASKVAHDLLSIDTLDERGHRAVMRAHVETGKTAQALKQFQFCKEALASELQASPAPETQQLADEIRGANDRCPWNKEPSSGSSVEVVSVVKPSKPTVAVLPFANLSGDREQDYFSDGITEDIITELSRFGRLFVIARDSSFKFRGTSIDASKAGQELGVRYIVKGSVRRAKSQVRVSAKLIDTISGSHVWAERYDRQLEGIFAVQDVVVQAIVATLAERITASEAERSARRPIADMAVYDLILRAYQLMGIWTKEPYLKAHDLLLKAVDLDPNCAQAHGVLAQCDAYLYWFLGYSRDILDNAFVAGERALSLDPQNLQGHIGVAQSHLQASEHDTAHHHFETAVRLNPNNANAVCGLGYCNLVMGHQEAAVRGIQLAMLLNPYHPDWYQECLGEVHYLARDYSAAIEAFNRMRHKQAWTHGFLAASYSQLGLLDKANEEALALVNKVPHDLTVEDEIATSLQIYKDQTAQDHWSDGYRKAGLIG